MNNIHAETVYPLFPVLDQGLTYVLLRSRRRSLALEIQADLSVVVRSPLRMSISDIESFIRSKSSWITKKRSDISQRLQIIPPKTSMQIYHRGQVVQWPHSERKKVQFQRAEAVRLFEELIGRGLTLIGPYAAKYTGLSVKRLKRRWGSCTKSGLITLNTNLICVPDTCIWGVVIHELVHLIHHNHSERFYRQLEALNPEYLVTDKLIDAWSFVVLEESPTKKSGTQGPAEIRTILMSA
ncbi:MAG: DUF45 domain-containing protein [Ignavibacteria bacterium]|nr:DUF45 domain-containing protein [Ignavibacteria bacterium]